MKPVYGSCDSQKISIKSLEISSWLARDTEVTIASLHLTLLPYGIFLKFCQKYSKSCKYQVKKSGTSWTSELL
jgi:hypothetical protein